MRIGSAGRSRAVEGQRSPHDPGLRHAVEAEDRRPEAEGREKREADAGREFPAASFRQGLERRGHDAADGNDDADSLQHGRALPVSESVCDRDDRAGGRDGADDAHRADCERPVERT